MFPSAGIAIAIAIVKAVIALPITLPEKLYFILITKLSAPAICGVT